MPSHQLSKPFASLPPLRPSIAWACVPLGLPEDSREVAPETGHLAFVMSSGFLLAGRGEGHGVRRRQAEQVRGVPWSPPRRSLTGHTGPGIAHGFGPILGQRGGFRTSVSQSLSGSCLWEEASTISCEAALILLREIL